MYLSASRTNTEYSTVVDTRDVFERIRRTGHLASYNQFRDVTCPFQKTFYRHFDALRGA